MVTVSTKNQLKRALENKEAHIEIVGDLAKEIQKKSKYKTAARIIGATVLGGSIAAAPFTGGASLPGAIAGAIALTGPQIIAILIIIFGGSIPIIAMLKGYEVIDSNVTTTGGLKFNLRKKA